MEGWHVPHARQCSPSCTDFLPECNSICPLHRQGGWLGPLQSIGMQPIPGKLLLQGSVS